MSSTAFANQFSANVQLLSQQKASRLAKAVRNETLNGELGYFDQVGAVTPIERVSRHADTPFTEVPHSRRQVRMRDFELSEIIDSQDRMRAISEPESYYAQAFASAMGRQMDDVVIDAYFGTAFAGKTGQTNVTFPAGNQIAADYVETGGVVSSGLTVAKLRRAKERLDGAEAGCDPDEPRFLACTAREVTNLLRQTEVTSADYNTVRALVNGEVDTFMGFIFVRTERLPLINPAAAAGPANPRRVMAWVKSGVLLAMGESPTTNAAPDPTKGFNIRLHMKASFGATRMEEAKCVEIRCDPTA